MYSVIASDGKSYGPVDVATLKTWCLEGRVTPNTSVIDAISGRTIRASDLQDLYDVFPQQGPPTPPPPQPGYGAAQPGYGTQPPGFGTQTAPGGTPFGGAPYQNQYSNSSSPYAHPPTYGAPLVAQRSKVVAIILALLLGGLGIHRFYMGYSTIGIIQLLMTLFGWVLLGIPWIVVSIWVIVDIIQIATGSLKDFQGCDLA